MQKIKKWSVSQNYEEEYTIKALGLSEPTRDDFFRKRNSRKSKWSPRLSMFKPIDTSEKVIVEVGCCVTGPVHDFSEGIKIGLEPLIRNLKSWRDNSVCYIRAVGELVPLKDECVDVAISWNVLDHCIDPAKVLDEIRRVTKADGTFFILLNTFPQLVPRKLVEILDSAHLHHYTPCEAKRIVSKLFYIVDEKKMKGVARSGLKSIKEEVGNKMVTRLFLRTVKREPEAIWRK
jgi:SAM-dependent methyltransferase